MFSGMTKQAKPPPIQTLRDAYKVHGFRVRARIDSYEYEPPVFVITLDRRSKKRCVAGAGKYAVACTTNAGDGHAILDAGSTRCISTSSGAA
jgi:hypothetical protein